jgi:hypothetical protein
MWRTSFCLATLVALGLVVVPSVGNAQVTNLAPNPSFEEEDDVILNDAAYVKWWTWGYDVGLSGTCNLDDTQCIDGAKSLRVDAKGDINWYFIVADSPMPTKSGTKYTASFWAKAESPRPLTVQMKATDNTSGIWGTTLFQLTQDWAEYHFTTTPLYTEIKLEFLCSTSEVPFWLDFVYFYEGEYVPGIAPGGAAIRTKAAYPEPKDGAVLDQTWAKLAWSPGKFATSHKLYFGDSLDAVSSGQVAPVDTTATSAEVGRKAPFATALTLGKVYYWRVDEVNDANPDSPWPGDVWNFRVRPATAWNPVPADGIQYVHPEQDMTWDYGMSNVFHSVYFGEDFDTVSNATTSDWQTREPTFDPGTMKTGTTYYWRIDEFNGKKFIKGDIWSFTTVPDIAVVDADLLGWWTLDEGVGLTAVDWSGHGNHGLLIGDAKWTHGIQSGALYVSGGAHVEIPALNVATNTVTMTAWVKRDGSQADWAGVLFKRGGSAVSGMGFGPANELRYHWTDKNWDFATGIVPADQEWFFMALVVEPMQGTLYFNGTDTFARNKVTHDPDPFDDVLRIGQDWAGRDLKGTVDDVRFYNKSLSEAQIRAVMRGDLSLAWGPTPAPDAILDIRNLLLLSWSAGDGAASHDMYFGNDRQGIANADHSAGSYRGNQTATTFSPTNLVDLNTGDCFWRVDEVMADGTVHKGNVWQFTILPYLLVDDFESYTNDSPTRVFQTWTDGMGFSADEFFPKGGDGNGSGATVGYDPLAGNIMEMRLVHGGSQSMPVQYDNTAAPKFSEAERTFSPAQNWTVFGVKSLVVWFRGAPDNKGQLYVKINGTKVPYKGDAADIAATKWVEWNIDLASASVSVTSVRTLAIGVDGGEKGTLYIDDIRLIR